MPGVEPRLRSLRGRLSPRASTYSREWKAVGFSPRDCCHLNRETLCLDCAITGMSVAGMSGRDVIAQRSQQSRIRSRVGLETCHKWHGTRHLPAKIPLPALRSPEGNLILNSREQNRTTSLDNLPRIKWLIVPNCLYSEVFSTTHPSRIHLD